MFPFGSTVFHSDGYKMQFHSSQISVHTFVQKNKYICIILLNNFEVKESVAFPYFTVRALRKN